MDTRFISLGLAVLLAGGTSAGLAHEKAVLKSPQSAVAAGGSLTLSGSDFAKNASYALRLVSALTEYELGRVASDSEGTFSTETEIPGSVKPGQYKVTAIAPDGDVVASLDIAILEPSRTLVSGAETDPTNGPTRAQGHQSAPVARVGDLPIERARSGVEWGVIGLIIGLAGGLGIGLLRRASAQS